MRKGRRPYFLQDKHSTLLTISQSFKIALILLSQRNIVGFDSKSLKEEEKYYYHTVVSKKRDHGCKCDPSLVKKRCTVVESRNGKTSVGMESGTAGNTGLFAHATIS